MYDARPKIVRPMAQLRSVAATPAPHVSLHVGANCARSERLAGHLQTRPVVVVAMRGSLTAKDHGVHDVLQDLARLAHAQEPLADGLEDILVALHQD